MISRRKILVTGGASIVVVGASSAAFNLLHSNLTDARRPWLEAGKGFGDRRLDALSYAVLAPNPHNRQPWLVRLESDDRLTLYCELDRLLPETDPENRQIVIGLGAFLELLRQAAAVNAYRLDVDVFPEGEPHPALDGRPIAHIQFVPDTDVKPDPLFGAALERRTVRTKFDQGRRVSKDVLSSLGAALRGGDGEFKWVNDGANVEALKEICRASWMVEATTARTHHESTALTRIGEKEINENPDGISLAGPFMEAMRLAGLLTPEAADKPGSRAYRGIIDFYQGLIDSAMAFGWLATGGNSRADQLHAGAGWVRLHLEATRQGLAMHSLSQALQEFPEMTALFEEIHNFAGVHRPRRVQGLFRFGYAKFPEAAPRWPLSSRIIEA